MMTVNEVSKLTGVSIRTLQYYDTIGLLKPIEYTESGYRLYDDTSLERLQQILLFKELEFPLKEIKQLIASMCKTYPNLKDHMLSALKNSEQYGLWAQKKIGENDAVKTHSDD